MCIYKSICFRKYIHACVSVHIRIHYYYTQYNHIYDVNKNFILQTLGICKDTQYKSL